MYTTQYHQQGKKEKNKKKKKDTTIPVFPLEPRTQNS